MISQPSRVTRTTSTLIANIFINNIDSTFYSGLLLCDISDHLPVFIVYGLKTGKKIRDVDKVKYIRIRTEKEIGSFRKDLINQDWSKVLVEDVNNAYEVFLNIFVTLYNKNCPLKMGK